MKKLRTPRFRPSHALVFSAGYGMVAMAMAQVSAPQVSSDAANVYYKVPYSGSPQYVRVFIDNDHNAGTGYVANGVGSGYLVENGNLYRYSGSNNSWSWSWVKKVPYNASNGNASFSIARDDLSKPGSIDSVAQVSSPTYTSSKVSTTLASSSSTTTAGAPTSGTGTTSTTSTTSNTSGATASNTNTSSTNTSPTNTSSGTTAPGASTNATVQASFSGTGAAISNPERGFYNQVNCSDGPMNQSQLQNYRSGQNQSLVMCAFLLPEAVNGPISQSKLNLLQQQFDIARAAGVKLVMRFAYNYSDNATDAPLSVMLNHMDQLKPYLQNNKDVIAVVEAGFIGSWGEWGNSRNYGTGTLSSQQWSDRGTILNKLLSTVPSERMVQLRTPDFAYHLVGSSAVSASQAFNGSAVARVGQHNDCFLASSNDRGTYNNTSTDYPWLQAQTTYTPMGGETCGVSQPRSDCPTATAEMAKFHWSFLNAGFDTNVLNNWKGQGCYGTIEQKMGYRFVMKDGSFSGSAKPGGGLQVSLNLVNEGYAAPYNSRPVQLILRNDSSGKVYRVSLDADPRKWLPGQSVAINQSVTLPGGMEGGNYSLLLALPDDSSSLANRPEYSIQMANANTWESNTGFNKLNATVSIAP